MHYIVHMKHGISYREIVLPFVSKEVTHMKVDSTQQSGPV